MKTEFSEGRNVILCTQHARAPIQYKLSSLVDGREVNVGEYDSMTGVLDLTRGEASLWNGKPPPKDRTVRIIEHSTLDITLYAVLASAASGGIVLASIFLAINIRFRNQR